MKEVSKILKIVFWAELVPVVLFVILFETGVLEPGILKGGDTGEFIILTIMELFTIGVIPLALYMFKIKRIQSDLYERREPALRQWGLLRMDLLALPLVANVLFYYLYGEAWDLEGVTPWPPSSKAAGVCRFSCCWCCFLTGTPR